jgi:hypothetical protein
VFSKVLDVVISKVILGVEYDGVMEWVVVSGAVDWVVALDDRFFSITSDVKVTVVSLDVVSGLC